MILMIDNYDSFTYNLVQYLREMAADVQVYRTTRSPSPRSRSSRRPPS
jgi:anthranilate/para-aminobenzoate synthase component II